MLIGLVFLTMITFLVIGVIVYCGSVYIEFVALRKNVDVAWANLDIVLKQRHEEVLRLLQVCRGYMEYEDTLDGLNDIIISCTKAFHMSDKARHEERLSGLLKHLFAVSGRYVQLGFDQNYLQLRKRMQYLAEQMQERIGLYNNAVEVFNAKIAQPPEKVMADMLNLNDKEPFRVTEEEG